MNTVKILIIGDDAINIQIIKSRLLKFGDDWLIYSLNWEKSVSEIENSNYSLIIFECNNQDTNIVEKINQVKKSASNYETPILVCFQENNVSNLKEVLQAGALDFIFKPYKIIELFARVRTALSLSSSLTKLRKQSAIINNGQQRIETVLNGILPSEIISELTISGESKPKKYTEASVLFVDLVDFTKKSTRLSPKVIIDELSEIFSAFDSIVKRNGCTRIKTMGDGYLAVSGIPTPKEEHATNMVKTAIEMREFLTQRNKFNPVKWDAKFGINSGEVIGSVLGNNNFLFDIFGDAVNTASRMEKLCAPNQINVAQQTYLLTRHNFRYIERLPNDIKGVGIKKMYYIKSSIERSVITIKRRNKKAGYILTNMPSVNL